MEKTLKLGEWSDGTKSRIQVKKTENRRRVYSCPFSQRKLPSSNNYFGYNYEINHVNLKIKSIPISINK